MQKWELWEHQQIAVDRINGDWESGKKSICCQLPTGSGKTRVIRTIVDQFADKKKVVYVLAHRNTLVKQLSEELTEAGLQHGVIKSGSPYIRYRVQVCSMQTLVRRLDKLPEPALIIVDECFPAGTFIDGFGRIEDIRVNDIVDTYNEKENKITKGKVLSTFKKELKDDLIYIRLFGGYCFKCTKNHPIMTNKGWVKAENLDYFDNVLCGDMEYRDVMACAVFRYKTEAWIRAMNGSRYVYNFEVKDTHTYVVNHCVVHNCHHLKSSSYLKILDKWSNAKLLGMTATPERQDGKSLDVFDILEIGPSMKSLIKLGKLSDYDYYAPENVDMSGVKMQAGDYNKKQSVEKVDKACITGNVIEHYKKYADHKPTICCCISIAHSEHVAKEFRDAGYKALAVNSKMKTIQVDAAIAGLGNGKLEILTQCDMLGEGVDIPGVECLIQLRPTHSLVIFMQQCGRSLRAVKGKDKAIILDHVGNWSRFGLPDDERDWSLQGKKKKDKGKSTTKRCPECLQVTHISARVCPNCGYQWTETAEAGTRMIEEKEGELISVKSCSKAAQQELIRALAFAHNVREAKKISRTMGYKDGDATAVWFGVFHNKANTVKKF